jgi:RNAse (barnase) inhibitor barstar
MYSSAAFEFVRESCTGNVRVSIQPSIGSRNELFDAYAANLRFPAYFGRNWDAFIDCLSDLSWIAEAEVTVAHEGLPSLQTKDLRTYLECLLEVLGRLRPSDRPQLRLCFKETDRQAIDAVLSNV